jgi:translation initiation factor IF-3
MATDTARDIAGRVGLDLVEIAPTADPPVCKIMDYGRYKYELKKKAASAKKSQHQSHLKEIKLRPQISDHDFDFKLRNARKFLFGGDKVRCTVMFRGREIVHTQAGRDLLERMKERLGDVAVAESMARMEGRILSFTLAPNRPVIEKIKAKERAAEEKAARAEAAQASEETKAEAKAAQASEEIKAEAKAAQASGETKSAED